MIEQDVKRTQTNQGKATNVTSSDVLLPAFPSQPSWGFVAAYVINVGFFLVCVKTCLFDFGNAETALAFYGTFHREPLNQFIHFVGVPVILWTMIVFSAHLVVPVGGVVLPAVAGIPAHALNMGTLWILMYVAFYLSVDVIGAALYAPLLYLYYWTSIRWVAADQKVALAANKTPNWTGTGRLLHWSFVFHVLSWYVQIHAGHKVIEGASPAVLSNVGGALVAAPLFAFYEAIWAVGLRQGLHERIQELIAQYTAELCSQGAVMRVCETLATASN